MYRGDFRLGDTFDVKFTTRSFTTGAPTTLAGTPSIAAYPGNSTTEITAGITLTVDFDTRTGLHNVRVVATSGNGYATATNYDLVITAGTVGGVSVVGEVIGSFSIEARSAVMPTVAARTLDVSATGEAGVDWANVGSPTTTVNLSGTTTNVVNTAAAVTTVNGLAANTITATSIASDAITAAKIADNAIDLATFAADAKALFGVVAFGTAQSVTGTTIRLASAETFADDELIGATVIIRSATTGAGQSRVITDYVSATDTATVDTWTTTPTGTITYVVIATAPASTSSPVAVNVTQFGGVAGTFASGIPEVKVASIAANAITATSIASDAITDAKVASDVTIASVTGAVGSVTGNVGGNVTGSVGSVVGAVGSVTGNVGGNVVGSVGSVTGAVGSVTGAVGSVTGNVGGNVTGSVGSIATGGIAAASFAAGAIDAAAIAANAIGASELAADAAAEIADKILGRNVAGGSDGTRTVSEALYVLRNKTAISAGTLTVYQTDDATPAFTATVGTTAGNPISSIDPA